MNEIGRRSPAQQQQTPSQSQQQHSQAFRRNQYAQSPRPASAQAIQRPSSTVSVHSNPSPSIYTVHTLVNHQAGQKKSIRKRSDFFCSHPTGVRAITILLNRQARRRIDLPLLLRRLSTLPMRLRLHIGEVRRAIIRSAHRRSRTVTTTQERVQALHLQQRSIPMPTEGRVSILRRQTTSILPQSILIKFSTIMSTSGAKQKRKSRAKRLNRPKGQSVPKHQLRRKL